MSRPPSYQVQLACANCQFAFVRTDFDEGEKFYCTKHAPLRPLCMSAGMNEVPDPWRDEALDAWVAWAQAHHVQPHGKCTEWTLLRVEET
jgi:hypothetical protein